MKFMSTPELDTVSSTLNFATPDLHVLGGCDLYTTKAAGEDKKLTKKIDDRLEAQYKSDLEYVQSLPPSQAKQMAASLNLSRRSPFGNLGKVSSRRTYAYLIEALNASNPDYDFSQVLRPADFKRKLLREVMHELDDQLYNLRPGATSSWTDSSYLQPGSACPQPSQSYWGAGTWQLIDRQMSLKQCEIYCYKPDDYDSLDNDEEGTIWSFHYLFYNKSRKRVCYLYLRGVSVLARLGGEVSSTPMTPRRKRYADDSDSEGWLTPDLGARKRAKYWLGDRYDGAEISGASIGKSPTITPDHSSPEEASDPPKRPLVDEHGNYLLSDEELRSQRSDSKSTLRAVSEEGAGNMDV